MCHLKPSQKGIMINGGLIEPSLRNRDQPITNQDTEALQTKVNTCPPTDTLNIPQAKTLQRDSYHGSRQCNQLLGTSECNKEHIYGVIGMDAL